MRPERTRISALAISLLATFLTAAAADAAESGPTALTAADMLNLRAGPSADSEIVGRLPRGTPVDLLDGAGLQETAGGQGDRWVHIRVTACHSPYGFCVRNATGWVAESFLADENRLEAMTAWRQGELRAYHEYNGPFGYEIAPDGTFIKWEACGGDPDSPEICRRTGQLHRYRDLVIAKSSDGATLGILQIDADGGLCFIVGDSEEIQYDKPCDR